MGIIKEDNGLISGGGIQIGTDQDNSLTNQQMINGEKTITSNTLSRIDMVVFSYNASIFGCQWLENGSVVGTYPNDSLKITAISGNTFTIKWNSSSDSVSFRLLGKA